MVETISRSIFSPFNAISTSLPFLKFPFARLPKIIASFTFGNLSRIEKQCPDQADVTLSYSFERFFKVTCN